MKAKLTLYLKGLLIGIANSIPGVSGGTIAYILNVYDLMINALSLNIKFILKNFSSLLLLATGLLSGLFLFAYVLDELLYARFPLVVNLSFIGLILGSLNFVFLKTKLNKNKLDLKSYLIFLLGVMIVVIPSLSFNIDSQVITTLNFENILGLFSAGVIGSFAMIIPGISGSFVLLILGYYETIIKAVAELNIVLLLPVAAGIIIGLVGGAKLIKIGLSKYPETIYKLVLGLLVGSVFVIDISGFGLNISSLIGVIILIISAVLTNLLSQIKSTK
jgi:putative membrane protein